jgi:hypothetical protein
MIIADLIMENGQLAPTQSAPAQWLAAMHAFSSHPVLSYLSNLIFGSL